MAREGSTIPESSLDTANVIFTKVPLSDVLLAHRNAIPSQPKVRRVRALVKDERESGEVACR